MPFGLNRAAMVAGALAASLLVSSASAQDAVTSADVNVRAGPGTQYAAITVLPAGTPVDVEDCSGSWCRIVYRGVSGYVSRSYLDEEGAPPVVVAPPRVYVEPPLYDPPPVFVYPPYRPGWRPSHPGWRPPPGPRPPVVMPPGPRPPGPGWGGGRPRPPGPGPGWGGGGGPRPPVMRPPGNVRPSPGVSRPSPSFSGQPRGQGGGRPGFGRPGS